MNKHYDFSGWATKNNLRCSDGRTILKDAFKDDDGVTVPLVWNHQHNDSMNVLGHALLENRAEGVYAYCSFNETESGRNARELVAHGDVQSLSIYANQLSQDGGNVKHGVIREVSLVLAGANPGARILDVVAHGDGADETSAILSTGDGIELFHADEGAKEQAEQPAEEKKETKEEMADSQMTVGQAIESMNDEQKAAMYMVIEEALKNAGAGEKEPEEDNEDMKQNAFYGENEADTLNHSAMEAVLADGKRYGSLKESYMAHADEFIAHAGETNGTRGVDYGITNIGNLYPDAKPVNNVPDFYKRDTDWVARVMNGVHHTPFARVKSTYADITADEARARGYTTGKKKVEEVIAALKRTTLPTTIYKKQKMDRDDIIDITDFDVVSWLKGEMRIMLDEEIARAILTGDGRLASSDDKINEQNIRPIWTDDETYAIHTAVEVQSSDTPDDVAKKLIRAAVKSRKNYKGSGNPVMFATEDDITDMLLLEDGIGHRLYDTMEKLATAMRVSSIITVPVMENLTRTDTADGNKVKTLRAIIVNLNDYNVGADKGGAVNMFDDFDIDYNQQKYLIETRCSGALIKPKSAIVLETYSA